MASTIPNQERVVDPFASYNSNVVNKITEIVTHNTEGMLTVNSIQVVQDSTSPNDTVVIQPGYAVKDDVLIKTTAEHIVDFNDLEQWESNPGVSIPTQTCYIVLKYTYVKQRPAPQAEIKILQSTERNLINGTNTAYLLLKVVDITAAPLTIVALHDYDSEVGYESNARKYIKYYAGGEVNIPTFSQVTDQGRIAYESERDKFFFGHQSEWRELTVGGVYVDVNTDSTGVFVGQLCYVDNSGNATPAISTGIYKSADLIITGIGTAVSGIGRGIVSGYGIDVPVEAGIGVSIGDILYLSAIEAGTVTTVKPEPFHQVVGRALTSGSSITPIEMIFSPKLMLALNITGQISSWSGPNGTGYYSDIDVTALNGTDAFACHWFDDSTNREIRPSEVEIIDGGDYIRVYFPVNTLTVNYIIQ